YAKENGFDCFASTLTIGRNKSGEVINPIGKKWAEHFGIKFLEGDWKK
ncbi:recombinase, partial [Candidatus Saccharibacteria bacterium]|nr:epoxyqueuosine reductase QueH [Candidatus Saccharibacteria bacterium]NIV03146.1 recombinase [Calditrichia bacterium]NIV71253.1 recombinase [Calditrichia bacterium]NIV97727.1 recombinase [Candidatus Saccharibacteria bacterium]NIW78013.1 recombinase [Calditrichia bacterium]